jgi:hypothetical protein
VTRWSIVAPAFAVQVGGQVDPAHAVDFDDLNLKRIANLND